MSEYVCTCEMTDPSMWLSAASCGYGGGYEPGSQWEYNPDCPEHGIELASDGQANTCTHQSATGVDTTPIGPGKVWACDHCGLRWTDQRTRTAAGSES